MELCCVSRESETCATCLQPLQLMHHAGAAHHFHFCADYCARDVSSVLGSYSWKWEGPRSGGVELCLAPKATHNNFFLLYYTHGRYISIKKIDCVCNSNFIAATPSASEGCSEFVCNCADRKLHVDARRWRDALKNSCAPVTKLGHRWFPK